MTSARWLLGLKNPRRRASWNEIAARGDIDEALRAFARELLEDGYSLSPLLERALNSEPLL